MARGLCGNVLAGDKIFVDDGLLSFTVQKSNLESVECVVDNSGNLLPHKGINLSQSLPYVKPFLKACDREDLEFAVQQQVEFVTVSCVRNVADIQEIREYLSLMQQKHKQGKCSRVELLQFDLLLYCLFFVFSSLYSPYKSP